MQALDPAGRYNDGQVLAALLASAGSRALSFRFDRLNYQNNYVGPLDKVISASVSNDSTADIKRTATFTIADTANFNYLADRIKPWVRLAMPNGGYVEWPQGVFLTSSPTRTWQDGTTVVRTVEAYDQTVVLSDVKVTARYTIAAGVKYTDAMTTIAAGYLPGYLITASTVTLPTTIEWEPGTSLLTILNDLCSAINYASVTFDENGRLILAPYTIPSTRNPTFRYATDAKSVIGGSPSQLLDLFGVPNQWVLVKSEADETPLRSVYTNTSTSSPTSTVQRARTITSFIENSDAANQAALDALAARQAFLDSQVYEEITWESAIIPLHGNDDVYTLALSGLNVADNYNETQWSFPLVAGGSMSHSSRKVVTV